MPAPTSLPGHRSLADSRQALLQRRPRVARGVPNNQRFPFGAWRRPGDRPYLVSFIDNHDAFWQPGRIRSQADDNQVIGCIGFLLCALGTPCISHGTEQGLSGSGGDLQMRETMFDAGSGVSLLTTGCRIYQEIAKVAALMRKSEPPRFGRMYYRQISADACRSDFPMARPTLLRCRGCCTRATMRILYGGTGTVPVETAPSGASFVASQRCASQSPAIGTTAATALSGEWLSRAESIHAFM
jgi:hypothetical protein